MKANCLRPALDTLAWGIGQAGMFRTWKKRMKAVDAESFYRLLPEYMQKEICISNPGMHECITLAWLAKPESESWVHLGKADHATMYNRERGKQLDNIAKKAAKLDAARDKLHAINVKYGELPF